MNLKKIIIKDIEQLGSNIYLDFDNEELYLYLSSIKNISEPPKLYKYLSISEIEKANNFKFEEDTFRFILGHSLTRSILGKYLGIFPSKLTFKYGDSGKPQLENNEQNVFFNISHSNEFAAIIFSKIRSIGVDIEHIDKNKENEKWNIQAFNHGEKYVGAVAFYK
jgi:4'-phosphopantetheinyl transferase